MFNRYIYGAVPVHIIRTSVESDGHTSHAFSESKRPSLTFIDSMKLLILHIDIKLNKLNITAKQRALLKQFPDFWLHDVMYKCIFQNINLT